MKTKVEVESMMEGSYITNFKHNLKYNTTHKTRISNGYKNRTKVYLFSLKNENLKFVVSRLVRGISGIGGYVDTLYTFPTLMIQK